MAAITGFLPELVQELVPDYYTETVSILYAVETNNSGRVCKEWLAVPDPCDPSSPFDSVPAQFRFDVSETSGRTETGQRTETEIRATVDIPFVFDWLTTAMRIEYQGEVYKIRAIQPDFNIMTRLKLERTER